MSSVYLVLPYDGPTMWFHQLASVTNWHSLCRDSTETELAHIYNVYLAVILQQYDASIVEALSSCMVALHKEVSSMTIHNP